VRAGSFVFQSFSAPGEPEERHAPLRSQLFLCYLRFLLLNPEKKLGRRGPLQNPATRFFTQLPEQIREGAPYGTTFTSRNCRGSVGLIGVE